MVGVIDSKQAALHLGLIYREFGWRCTIRCLAALLRGRRTTFLDLAFDTAHRSKGPGAVLAQAA